MKSALNARPHAGGLLRMHGGARAGRLLPACRAAAAARGRAPSAGDSRASGVPQLPDAPGPVLVWFKHDLRVDDNPGLLGAAAAGAPLLPVFCLSPRLYSQLSLTPGGPAALLAGITQLRAALRGAGSDLVVRVGCPEEHLPGLAAAAGASRIVLEREEESRWLEASHRVAQALEAAGGAGAAVRMVTWQAPLWPRAGYDTNFRAWQKRRGKQPLPPLPPPRSLNGPLPAGIEPGAIPSLPELERLLAASLAAGQTGADTPHTAASEAAQASAAAAAEGDVWRGRRPARDALLRAVLAEPAAQPQAAAASQFISLLLDGSSSSSPLSSSGAVLTPAQLLTGYLQSSDGGAASDARLAFLAAAIAQLETPAAVGAPFPALLGPLLHLGLLSARQVHDITLAVEAARWGGRMPLLGPSTTAAKAALSAVELTDFHRALASHIPQEDDGPAGASPSPSPAAAAAAAAEPVASAASSLEEGPDGVEQWGAMDWPRGVPRRCSWRWRGALTDFTVVEPERPLPGAPALVLIHGFGAFGDQWRFNFGPLAEAGYTVYAPTLPGFGRSEKAALPYSQNAWRDFIRDFLVCVVGRPAVLAGNSIGGFISASTAADYPALVAGLALVNSAGPVTPGVTEAEVAAMAAEVRKPPPAWVVRGTTWALMTYLQSSIGKQLQWLYPTNPGAADAWLKQEIYRAACDARSADVFASVFYLPKPRPLNYLVNNLWKGPTGVVQGVLDPLNDAQGRADLLERECPGLRVWAIQAGHCPHDEAPQAVNAALLEFVEQMVLPQQQQQQQATASAPAAAAVVAN